MSKPDLVFLTKDNDAEVRKRVAPLLLEELTHVSEPGGGNEINPSQDSGVSAD